MIDGPAARQAREWIDDPAAQHAREMMDGPAARLARKIAVHTFEGKGIEIGFFDFARGNSSRGWITKKNFKREK